MSDDDYKTLARLRWQHIKDRAAKEGVGFGLSVELFEKALIRGIPADMIFPDKTPADRAQWTRTLADWKRPS